MAVKAAPKAPNGNGKAVKEIAAPVSVEANARGMGLGRTGLRQWSGRIDEEFLKELKNERKYQVYKEMSENDPIVGAVLRAIEFLIRGVSWSVDPEDQDEDQELADQISERLFHGMERSWPDVLVEILSFLPFGWSFHEVLYESRDDGIWWKDWPIRSQDSLYRWVFKKDAKNKDTDEVIAMEQQAPTDTEKKTIPLDKGLLFRLGSHKNNPEGISIIRNAYLPWYYKNHLQRIEAIGIERDLAGYPVLYVPGEVLDSVSSAAYLAAQKIVTNIKRDEQEGALLSSARDQSGNMLWELKLLSTGGARSFNTNEIIQRYDTRIAQTCLADFIVLGQQKVGSFALASSKTEIFSLALAAILDTICGTVNRHAIPKLAELNGWPTDKLPKLVHGDIEMPDLQEIGAYITALSGAGIPLFPDMKLENRLRGMGGLPEITSEEFDTREAQAAADKQLEMDAQLEAAKAGAQNAQQTATDAKASSDKTAEAVKQLLERPVEKAQPQPIHLTVNGAPVSVTSPPPGAQMFNITTPAVKSETNLVQPIEVHPAAAPTIPVTIAVEAAQAPAVTVPVTIEASAPVVVPAPQVTTVIDSPVLVERSDTIVNVATAEAPIVKVDAPVTVNTEPIAGAIREQTAEQKTLWEKALAVIERVFKRPKSLGITLPDGTKAEAKPNDD